MNYLRTEPRSLISTLTAPLLFVICQCGPSKRTDYCEDESTNQEPPTEKEEYSLTERDECCEYPINIAQMVLDDRSILLKYSLPDGSTGEVVYNIVGEPHLD